MHPIRLTTTMALLVALAQHSSAQIDRYAPVDRAPPTESALPFRGQDLSGEQGQPASVGAIPPPLDRPAPMSRPTAPATAIDRPPRTYGSSASRQASATMNTTAATEYAERLMRDTLSPPAGSKLSGQTIYLNDVVGSGTSRSEQSEAVGAYWDLCSAVADYYLSLHEQTEFQRLALRSGQATPQLREAVADLVQRRDTALIAARASQLRLASLMGRNGSSPLPGDMPLCGVYHTRYSQNFPSGSSQEAAELNRLLPLRHAELLAAATAVGQQEDWFRRVAGQATNDQGEGVIKALQFLALNRRAFVQIARDYNRRIARYTELARPGQLRTGRLVAMLIKADSVARRSSPPPTPNSRTRSQTEPPPTFQQEIDVDLDGTAIRIDREVVPTGAIKDQSPIGASEDPNMVEKIAPGESSVLIRDEEP